MEALFFETEILENGTIKIPELSKWKNKKIRVFIIEEQKDNSDSVEEPVTEYRALLSKSQNQIKVKNEDF